MFLKYQITGEEEATVYRAYGTSPIVTLPECIDTYRVTAVGAYCFADRKRMPENLLTCRCREPMTTETGERDSCQNGQGKDVCCLPVYMGECTDAEIGEEHRELAGEFVEQVVLPDSVRQIGNAAFFGCHHLAVLEIGVARMSIGSDVFNNCSRLKRTLVRGSASEASGIRHVLQRISWEMEVQFEDAILLYPEYSESYDTIAPAHIFGLSIEGEGFRARQCFRNDVVDFSEYDAIFEKARATETVKTLGIMALNRLMMPVQLAERHRDIYEQYIRTHCEDILPDLVTSRERDRLEFVCQNQYAEASSLEQAVNQAAREDWSEGAASLMEWKHRYYAIHKKNRYEF